MAISVRAAGTWAVATTQSPTVTIPAGYQAGDLGILVSVWRPYSVTATIDQSWNEIIDESPGSTANGIGVGSSRLFVAYKELAASETNPTLTRSAAITPGGQVIIVLQKGAADKWDVASISAAVEQAMATTAMSHVLTTTGAIRANDLIFALTGVADDSATFTRATTAISGGPSWGADVVEYPATHASSKTGNDMAADLIYRAASSDVASGQSITVTATLSAAERVASVLFRVRVNPLITPSAIGSAEAFGTATISVAAPPLTIAPTAIDAPGAGYDTSIIADDPLGFWRVSDTLKTDVVLVVADKAAPTTSDAAIRDRLEDMGFTVTLYSDEDSAPSMTDVALVVIAESCTGATVGTKYSNVSVPVLTLDGAVAVNMDMQVTTESSASETQATVVDQDDIRCAFYAEAAQTVFSSAGTTRFATDTNLGSGYSAFLTRPAASTQKIGYGYAAGAAMLNSHTAEARRAYLGLFHEDTTSIRTAATWMFFEGVVTWLVNHVATDAMGNHHGIYWGVPAVATGLVSGGSAKTFNGIRQRIVITSIARLLSSAWTNGNSIELWFKPAQDTNEEHPVAFSLVAGSYAPAIMRDETSDKITYRDDGDAGATSRMEANAAATTGTIYHIVATRDSSNNGVLYINGVAQTDTGTALDAPPSDGWFFIGGEFDVATYPAFEGNVQGVLAEVAVYDYKLTQAQVSAHYSASTGGSAVGSPTLTIAGTSSTIQPTGIASAEAFGTTVISAGATPLTISPTSIASPSDATLINSESFTILLVVADAAAPTAGDQMLADHLRVGLGASVTLISDETAEPSLTGYDAVVISESCTSTTLAAKYKTASIGVVTAENGAWDDIGLITGTAGANDAQTQLDISGSHAVKWDVPTGTQTVASASSDFRHSANTHGANAVKIAAVVGSADNWVVFAYAAGATLADSTTAAGRRVALGYRDTGLYANLNAYGWAIFDAAVRWAAGNDNPAFDRSATFISDVDAVLDQGELALISRLRGSGFGVTVVNDDSITGSTGASDDLIVISKTIDSTKLGSTLKSSPVPVLFWEDNAQADGFFGTIDDTNVTGTAWHGAETQIAISASAPAALKAGLSGTIDFYRTVGSNNITYAPETDGGAQTLGADAIKIAEFDTSGDGRWSLYVYEAGDTLGDGTTAAGRRGYFGLYDANDEARYLTLDAIALWDAMVSWLAGSGTDFGQLTVILGETPPASIAPAGIASTEAFGTATILRGGVTVQPSAINGAEAFGTTTIVRGSRTIQPSTINSAEAFGTATILRGNRTLQLSAIVSAEAFGTPTITRGSVAIQPSGVATSEAFGTATLARGGVTVLPTGLPSVEVFGTTTIQRGAVSIQVSSIDSSEAFGSATLTAPAPGTTILPTGITSLESFGTAVIARGTVSIQPTAISSTEASGTPSLRTSATIIPTAVASAQSLGTPALAVGGVAIQPSAITTSEAFGSLFLAAGQLLISPTSISSAEQFGTAALRPGSRTVATTGIASGEAVGTPVLVKTASVLPSGIASSEQTGLPAVIRGAVTIGAQGITTGEGLGSPTIVSGTGIIVPTAIGSAQAFGNPTISIASIPSQSVEPIAIVSNESFGTAALRAGNINLILLGIGTEAVIPNPVLYSYNDVSVIGISSAELFGLPVIAAGPAYVLPTGVTSEEAFGGLTVLNLSDSWLWVNRSPGFTGTRTGGFPVAQNGLNDTIREGFPVLQSGHYGTRRQEGEG